MLKYLDKLETKHIFFKIVKYDKLLKCIYTHVYVITINEKRSQYFESQQGGIHMGVQRDERESRCFNYIIMPKNLMKFIMQQSFNKNST